MVTAFRTHVPTIPNFAPRPSQRKMISELQVKLTEVDRVLCISSTGSGKTVMIGHSVADLLLELYPGFQPSHTPQGWRCPVRNPNQSPPQIFFVVHRNKLVKQTLKSFKKVFASRFQHDRRFNERTMENAITVFQSGKPYDWFSPIVIVSQQSLSSKKMEAMTKIGRLNPKYIFYDEAHTTATNPSGVAMSEFFGKVAKIVGFTATPFWADKEKVASNFFDAVICGKSFGELVASGELCLLQYLQPDYPSKTIEEYMDPISRTLKTREVQCGYNTEAEIDYFIDKWLSIGGDKLKTICFARDVNHGRAIVKRIKERGYKSAIVSYKESEDETIQAFQDFELGDLNILVSVDSLGVGYDFDEIQVVALLAPTESTTRHWQQMGRGARLCLNPKVTKHFCYVIDFVKNIDRHGEFGIPDNVIITPDMILGKKARKKGSYEAPTKTCPKCDFINFASSRTCRRFDIKDGKKNYVCEHAFPIRTLAEPCQIIPGDLHRVFLPGMSMSDKDCIEFFRSLRAKRYARNQNPNIGILDYNDSPLSAGLKIPGLKNISELKPFTVGAIRGKKDNQADAEKWLRELLRLKKKKPLRWTTEVIFSLIYLEYSDEVANTTNTILLTKKVSLEEEVSRDLELV